MNPYDKAANDALWDVVGKLTALILNGNSKTHPWQPSVDLLDRLIQAQQAVFAAQRLLEVTPGDWQKARAQKD